MPDQNDPPSLSVVSENSERELARKRALEDMRWPMRELAANLIRVVRGAGRAYELPDQMTKVLLRMKEYHTIVGYWPSDGEISACINIRYQGQEYDDDWSIAEHQIVQGALQMAASDLVQQSTQRSRGSDEIFEGFLKIEKIRESNRREGPGSRRSLSEREAAKEMDQAAEKLGKISKKRPRQKD